MEESEIRGLGGGVEDETDAAVSGRGGQGGHDILGAGHLGHQFRMDEADRLDAAGAGGLETQDEVGAGRGVEDGLLVLQAIAGADLDNLDWARAQRRVSAASGAGAAVSTAASAGRGAAPGTASFHE